MDSQSDVCFSWITRRSFFSSQVNFWQLRPSRKKHWGCFAFVVAHGGNVADASLWAVTAEELLAYQLHRCIQFEMINVIRKPPSCFWCQGVIPRNMVWKVRHRRRLSITMKGGIYFGRWMTSPTWNNQNANEFVTLKLCVCRCVCVKAFEWVDL